MRKICVITGTRAEYGLLKPLIQQISDDQMLELQLIATAMHLSVTFGRTINEIQNDGFQVSKKVECLLASDTSVGVSKSMAIALSGFADAFDDLKPDLVVVLGDRTEILSSVIAASIANIPVAHIHGGETTEGAYDESIRHSITKFSQLHFAASEIYKNRIIQLGEHPSRVFNVGAIGLDSIKNLTLLDRNSFEDSIGFKLNNTNLLITYHPVTLESESPRETFKNLLAVLDEFEQTTLIFTHANSDKNGLIINQMIHDYVSNNKNKAIEFASLGQIRYLSALQFVDAVVGNSSSGIFEVPMFNIPTINIGDRQKGRLMPKSVINCGNSKHAISEAFDHALDSGFTKEIQTQDQLFGNGTASSQILKLIKENKEINLKKSFYDLKF